MWTINGRQSPCSWDVTASELIVEFQIKRVFGLYFEKKERQIN